MASYFPLIELTYTAFVHSILNKNRNFTNVLIIWQLANMQQLEHAYVVQVTKANTGKVNGMSVSHAFKHMVIDNWPASLPGLSLLPKL